MKNIIIGYITYSLRRVCLWFLLLYSLSSCISVQGNIDNIEEFLKDEDFELEAIYYGGFAGQCKVTYNFVTTVDSVSIYVLTHCISPKEVERLRISKSEYNRLIENILCLSELHQNTEVTKSGCSPPWDTEYLVKRGFNKVRIFPSSTESCSIEKIIYLHKKYDDSYL